RLPFSAAQPVTHSLQCDGHGESGGDGENEGKMLLLDGLIAGGVTRNQGEESIIPALQTLPGGGAEASQRIVAGGREQREGEEGRGRSGVIREAEEVVAQGQEVPFRMVVDVVEPG